MRQKHYTGPMLAAKPCTFRSAAAQNQSGNIDLMMKNVMKTGAVSLALAAATLFAQTASAAPDRNDRGAVTKKEIKAETRKAGKAGKVQTVKQTTVQTTKVNYAGNRGYTAYHKQNRYGNNSLQVMRRNAVNQCASAIQRKTDRAFPGPYGVANYKFRPNVQQIGPRGFKVQAPVRVSGRKASTTMPTTCIVRKGQVVELNYRAKKAFNILKGQQNKRRFY